MTIKSFEEWLKSKNYPDFYFDRFDSDDLEEAYNVGIKVAKDQWELEKIEIHAYYDKHIKKLMGHPDNETEPNEENHGRLT